MQNTNTQNAGQHSGEGASAAPPLLADGDLLRNITITEAIKPDGTRMIECISESFRTRAGLSVSSADAEKTARNYLGMDREKERLPQAVALHGYPCPDLIKDRFRCWPERRLKM